MKCYEQETQKDENKQMTKHTRVCNKTQVEKCVLPIRVTGVVMRRERRCETMFCRYLRVPDRNKPGLIGEALKK
jgi:hypothetical protein